MAHFDDLDDDCLLEELFGLDSDSDVKIHVGASEAHHAFEDRHQSDQHQLEDLDDDCLLLILDRLPPNHLFKMLKVNKRLKRMASEKIRNKIKAISVWWPQSGFAECWHHLGTISQDQILALFPNQKFPNEKSFFNTLHDDPSRRAGFLSLLSKCAGVKSINFGSDHFFRKFNLPNGLLLEVVQRCPQLECLQLGNFSVDDEECHLVLEKVGKKIVHIFKNREFKVKSEARLLEVIAEKCPNIRQIYWYRRKDDLSKELKMLPKSCWVIYTSGDLKENIAEDVDQLGIYFLDWSLFGRRVNRLSSLSFVVGHHFVNGVEFARLKKLDLSECLGSFNYLVTSRFPQLEEFCFNASAGLTDDVYDAIFQKMTSTKKLTLVYNSDGQRLEPKLPQSSIHQLKNLKVICIKFDLHIWCDPKNYQLFKDFLQQIEHYVDGISLLKKLTVDIWKCHSGVWHAAAEDMVKRLKVKQSRVEIVLIA